MISGRRCISILVWTIHHEFPDHAGRPMPMLPFGEPIPELAPVT